MWPTNLDGDERTEYVSACNQASTKVRVEVDLLTLDHEHVQSLDQEFDDGQVNFNRGADIDQTLQAGFYDPKAELLDLDLRYLIQVKHHLWVPALDQYAICPVFTGRIVVPSSEGDVSTLEAHSKETFGLAPGAPRRTWRAGQRVAHAIREMFEDIGETKFRIAPNLRPKLKSDYHSGGPDAKRAPMRVARKMAGQPGLQVFYDELGYLVVRNSPKFPVASWNEGDDDSGLIGPVSWTRDLREVRNVVRASGKKKLSYTAEAPDNHVFSAANPDMKRGGKKVPLVHYWDADSISKRAELKEGAENLLDRLLTQTAVAQFECMPLYHVGPYDRIRAQKRNGTYGEFFPSEATKALGGGGHMTVGYQQRQRKQSAGRIK